MTVKIARVMPMELIHTYACDSTALPLIGDFVCIGNRLFRVDGRTWAIGSPEITLHVTERTP